MPLPHLLFTCAGVAVSSVIILNRLNRRKCDDDPPSASPACAGCNATSATLSHRSHESPRAPGILPERPVGTFCAATRRQAALQAGPSNPSRTERLLRLQASTVLSTTKYIQLLSCILVCLSSVVIMNRPGLVVSLVPVLGLLLLNVAVLEFAVRRPASLRLPSGTPSPAAEAEEQKPGPVLHPVMPHVHMLPYRSEDISGLWIKDRKRSDSMGPACDLMQMNGLVRKAIVLMKGVQISLTDERFTVSVVSVIPLLKITETYHVNGQMAQHKRRDLRRGKHYGRVEITSAGIVLIVRWDEPLAGYGSEVFRLISPTELHVESQMRVGRNEVKYTAIYNKKS